MLESNCLKEKKTSNILPKEAARLLTEVKHETPASSPRNALRKLRDSRWEHHVTTCATNPSIEIKAWFLSQVEENKQKADFILTFLRIARSAYDANS